MRMLVVLLLLLSMRPACSADAPCEHTTVERSASPDQRWQAVVDEATCGAGPYASDVTATVRVGRVGSSTAVAVLGVDTAGHAEDRPRIAWSGTALDVTVPNLSFLKVLELHPGDVRVHLHFDPDDPAARKAWLKEHNLAPD